jgi:hypothetical protein
MCASQSRSPVAQAQVKSKNPAVWSSSHTYMLCSTQHRTRWIHGTAWEPRKIGSLYEIERSGRKREGFDGQEGLDEGLDEAPLAFRNLQTPNTSNKL